MKLLTPIRLGPIELKNRVVSTAHEAYPDFFGPGSTGDRYVAYQERRAAGGAGLLILTAMHVHRSSQLPHHRNYEPADLAGKIRKLAARVHPHGTRFFAQLFHLGAVGRSEGRSDLHPLWAFSDTVSTAGETAHAMSGPEVEQVIDAFVDAAVLVTANGADGVELHGAHGYLIQQSFSPYANRRTDQWGQRLHFVKVLAQRVREAIGPTKALGLRISVDDFIKPSAGGLGPEEMRRIAAELMATGLFDYLNHSEGSGGGHYARAVGNYRHPLGEYLPLTKALRDAIGGCVPLIGVSKIATPDLAERAIAEGYCDLVGMTRAQIADPDLVRKLESGQGHRIRICTGANQGCIDRAGAYPIACIQNPEVGEEERFRTLPSPAPVPKKVLVVGGGPAGLKAAEIAARRGHRVTLAEAGDRIGGRLNLVATIGDAANLLAAVSWIERELADLPVDVMTHTRVDEAFVRDLRPDAIVLATGAAPVAELDVTSDGSIPVISTDDAVLARLEDVRLDLKGVDVLLVDRRANYETALVVEALVRHGSRVTVATPFLQFGANVGWTNLAEYLRLLPKWRVKVHTSTALTGIAAGRAELRNSFSGEDVGGEFGLVVAGVAPRSRDGLRDVLGALAPIHLVGDAVAPRSVLEAIREGDRVGRTI